MLFNGFSLMACPGHFLVEPGTTISGMAPPTTVDLMEAFLCKRERERERETETERQRQRDRKTEGYREGRETGRRTDRHRDKEQRKERGRWSFGKPNCSLHFPASQRMLS